MPIKRIFAVCLLMFVRIVISPLPVHAETTRGTWTTYTDPFPFTIYLPDSIPTGEKIPVLYLFHGQSMDETIWQKLGIKNLLDRERLFPFAIVLPREANYMESLETAHFDQQFWNEIKPFIEQQFPVQTQKTGVGIGGLSRGALWAQKIAFPHETEVGVLLLLSPPDAVFSDYIIYRMMEDRSKETSMMSIGIWVGTDDYYLKGAMRLFSQLALNHVPFRFETLKGAHDELFWAKALPEMLQFWQNQEF